MPGRPASRPRPPGAALPAIVLEGFASRLGLGIVSLALPLYGLKLGMSVAAVGLLVSVNALAQLLAKPLLGSLVDRIGLRRSLLIAIAVRSAIPLALVVASAPWQLFAIRACYGLGQALRDPALNAVIAQAGGKNRVASTFAWYHTAKNAAASIGRAVAGAVLAISGSNYPLVFAIAALVSVLPVLTVAVTVHPVESVPVPGRATGQPARLRLYRVAPFTGLAFLFGTTAGMLNLFPVIAAGYLGLGPAQIGGIILAGTMVMLVGAPVCGWFADHVSRRLVLAVRAVANAASSVLYLVLPGVLGAGLAKSVDDFGKAAFRPAWGSMMAEVAARDPARRARTMALIELGEDGGDALGPVLAGALLAVGGLPLMLGLRVLLAAVTELTAHLVGRRLADTGPERPDAEAPEPGTGPPARSRCPAGSREAGMLTDLQVAAEAVHRAVAAIQATRARGLQHGVKAGNEVVTSADRAADETIRATILQADPAAVIFSEEAADPQARHAGSRVWIVDPLDGTGGFARGENDFGVSVGLAVDGRAVVGAVYVAARNAIYAADAVSGAWLGEQRVGVSSTRDARRARVLMSRKELAAPSTPVLPVAVRPAGSTACKLAMVAAGEADAMVSYKRRKEWGSCAGAALVIAAGGMVTELDGSPLLFNRPPEAPASDGVVAANPTLHPAILKLATATRAAHIATAAELEPQEKAQPGSQAGPQPHIATNTLWVPKPTRPGDIRESRPRHDRAAGPGTDPDP